MGDESDPSIRRTGGADSRGGGAGGVQGARTAGDRAHPWKPVGEQVASLSLPDGRELAVWKAGDCYQGEERGIGAYGSCGVRADEPWLDRNPGIVAGATGETVAAWVSVNGGPLIPVQRHGHFLGRGDLASETASIELLDASFARLTFFPDVPVGGTPG